MRSTPQPLVVMVPQRHEADCGSAALAMYLPAPYEEVILAFGTPAALHRGVWLTDLIRAAACFGVTLKKRIKWDPEHDEGLAQVQFARGARHVVVIRAGLVFDTDLAAWDAEDYLTAKDARFGPLLVRA